MTPKFVTIGELLLLLLLFLLAITCTVHAFQDESIFEDEDIYNQAVQPPPNKGLTAPGTKWCGPGTTAANYSDLGTHRDTDMCCREHDHCEEIIKARSSLYNLNNTDWFPILKCNCEQRFLNCLQRVNSRLSKSIGSIYFSARSKCFNLGHPILSCQEHQRGTFRKRCIVYKVDNRKSKQWQFYDIPFYSLKLNTTNSL